MKQVLYISYDGMTDNLGQSQIIPYLIGLSSFGYRFTILSCEKRSHFEKKGDAISTILKAAEITWEPIFYTKKPPVISTLYDFFKLKQKSKQIKKTHDYKIVHCRSYIPALLGLWLKKKYDVKFIFDMRGFWPDERVEGKLWNLKNPLYKSIYRYFKNKEKEFILKANAIISLTRKGANLIESWPYVTKELSIYVIPCCVDTNLFDPDKISNDDKTLLKSELGISEDQFVLCYLGSIGTWYMLDEMLDFFVELKKSKPNSKFLFITHDEHERIINTAVKKQINKEDIIIKPTERNAVPLALSICDYSIFFIRPTFSKTASSPVKQGEIMAMGIPLICNAGIGDTDEVVNKYKSGICLESFDFENIDIRLKNFSIDPVNVRSGAIDYFSLNKGIEQYLEIYNDLN